MNLFGNCADADLFGASKCFLFVRVARHTLLDRASRMMRCRFAHVLDSPRFGTAIATLFAASNHGGSAAMSLGSILVLIIAVLGALPTWPYSARWGYYASGSIGVILLIVLVLFFPWPHVKI
jgi:hypothetical protein